MRTIKLIFLIIIGVALMLIVAANMTRVDLHLVPQALNVQLFSLTNVPLAVVIVLAALFGFVIAMLFEMIRNFGKNRRLEEKRREISRLKEENAKLIARLGVNADDLALGIS